MKISNAQIDTQNEVSEGLPSKVEIDIEKSILNSITDDKYDKLIEGFRRLAIEINKVGLEMVKSFSPIAEWSKEISGVYSWQDDCASL